MASRRSTGGYHQRTSTQPTGGKPKAKEPKVKAEEPTAKTEESKAKVKKKLEAKDKKPETKVQATEAKKSSSRAGRRINTGDSGVYRLESDTEIIDRYVGSFGRQEEDLGSLYDYESRRDTLESFLDRC